ncbi:hypothetical protein T265_05428 [Opisthorchis viverrini]|uniref:Uncharacterized protein n=1 Tax=Opisthorchis viverrini TaxID=6198 RepID=A0A074ZJL1_OPIVI|nr:hypothetical protein T265_05428 [Opisthorchis viverrini]KER27538.1 hypothetical protein T265_05428 [Opisthorchis viverrini]
MIAVKQKAKDDDLSTKIRSLQGHSVHPPSDEALGCVVVVVNRNLSPALQQSHGAIRDPMLEWGWSGCTANVISSSEYCFGYLFLMVPNV